MINIKIEQKSFIGEPEKVLGNVVAYIEELKGIFESEVFQGLGFGLIFYHLKDDGGDVVVLKSNRIVRDLDSFESTPPLIFSDNLQAWNRALNILRDWKYVEPSSIIYGWKQKHSFTFSHSMAISTMAADESIVDASKVVECLIFKSVTSGILPFLLIDGALAPPRSNALCMVQAAPEENLLYSSLKRRVEEEPDTKFYFVKTLLRSKRPAVLLDAFKYLHQMKCPEELFEAALEACLGNISSNNAKLLEAMERAIFLRPFVASAKVKALTGQKTGVGLYHYLDDPKPNRRRIAVRFYLSSEQQPRFNLVEKLARDPDDKIRQLVAEKLGEDADDERQKILLYELAEDPSDEVRLKALKALANKPSEEIYRKLIHLTKDPNASIRAATVSAFASEIASPWVERIIEMLEDPNGEVFKAAARALRYAATFQHVPLLREMYQRLKTERGLNGSLTELEWTVLALEGNISELERVKESCGLMFGRIWISPVIRRAKEIQQERQREQTAPRNY